MDSNKIVAIVNGIEITGEDYNIFMSALAPEVRNYFANMPVSKEIIDELVGQKLLYLDAIENNMDKNEDFIKVMEKSKESLLQQYALGKLLKNVEVTEEEIQSFYEENKEVLKEKESVNASHILVEDLEKAEDLYKKIKDGENFEELAKEFSTCPSNAKGGNLGDFTRGQMVKEFDEKVFSMEVGEISEPIKTQFGYHIIKLNDKKESKEKSIDELKDRIHMEVRRKKEQELYRDKLNSLKERYNIEYK